MEFAFRWGFGDVDGEWDALGPGESDEALQQRRAYGMRRVRREPYAHAAHALQGPETREASHRRLEDGVRVLSAWGEDLPVRNAPNGRLRQEQLHDAFVGDDVSDDGGAVSREFG